jgi:fission process protein 1
LGLAAVPALPYLFDEPVEHATEWVFHSAFRAIGGPAAVGEKPVAAAPEKPKEKEL